MPLKGCKNAPMSILGGSMFLKGFAIIIITAIHSLTLANSFELIKDGIKYRCNQVASDPGGTVACVDKAYSGPFTKDESIEICQGSNDTAPAECAIHAYNGPFSKNESIRLCKFAYSISPAECANKAYSGPFTKEESISLCDNNGTLENAECAIRAYAGPYTKEEAVYMCKTNPTLLNRMLKVLHHESVLGFEATLHKSIMKAQSLNELNTK